MADIVLAHSYHLQYDPKQVRKMQPYPPLGTLYAATGTWSSIKGPSLAEMQLVRDLDALKNDIAKEGPAKLFANPQPISVIKVFAGSLDLESHYDAKATGPGGRLVYFVRRD